MTVSAGIPPSADAIQRAVLRVPAAALRASSTASSEAGAVTAACGSAIEVDRHPLGVPVAAEHPQRAEQAGEPGTKDARSHRRIGSIDKLLKEPCERPWIRER